jgi:hypothetical protein
MLRRVTFLVVALATAAAAQAPPSAVDTAVADFLQAQDAAAIEAAADRIAATRAGFEEVSARLRRGRAYSADVPRGVVQGSYRGEDSEYFYTLDVPSTYAPSRRYPLRVQLHGGVGRIAENTRPASGTTSRLGGGEQIYLMPYAWREAPWWSERQMRNLRSLLEIVKRTYNVDENRVVLSGVSDGGTGAWFAAMRDTTPFASFLSFNGFIGVLRNELAERDGDVFPNNLLNKPLFVVNGGRDPIYPTSLVGPFIDHLKAGGVDLVYSPQANAGHDTSWWPDLKDPIERFVEDHPRRPLPDRVTWESSGLPARAHWLIIDRLAPSAPDDPLLPDVNRRNIRPTPEFGIRASGNRVNRVVPGSNAAQLGLAGGDVVVSMNNQQIGADVEVGEALRGFPPGRPLLLTVVRGGQSIRLTGRYAPTVLPGEADEMFPPAHPSGRIELVRTGNRVEAKTRSVAAFTLLLSPDQFNFDEPVTVVVNGRTAVQRVVSRDLRILLKWAARDNDRTMLFGAELQIDVPR